MQLAQLTRLGVGVVLPVAWAAPEHGRRRHTFDPPGGDALVLWLHSAVISTPLSVPVNPFCPFGTRSETGPYSTTTKQSYIMLPPLNMRATHCPVGYSDGSPTQVSRPRWHGLVPAFNPRWTRVSPASKLRVIALMALLPLVSQSVKAQPIICRETDGSRGPAQGDTYTPTHYLSSGVANTGLLKIGISTNGGGYMNYIQVPGLGVVMAGDKVDFGVGGQSSIRDERHGLRYNPTTAGFTPTAGTVCTATTTADSIILPERYCCLWFGDGFYYFNYWQDLANDGNPVNGDEDEIDNAFELAYPKKQIDELTSEFNLTQRYSDLYGKQGNATYAGDTMIKIPTIRHYYCYDYRRDPGVVAPGPVYSPMRQFPNDTSIVITDIPTINPAPPMGQHYNAGRDSMGNLVERFAFRILRANWDPAYCYNVKDAGDENNLIATDLDNSAASTDAQVLTTYVNNTLLAKVSNNAKYKAYDANGNIKNPRGYRPLIILSDSANPGAGNAVGLFFPPSEMNNKISGMTIDNAQGKVVSYRDDRRTYTVSEVIFKPPGGAPGAKGAVFVGFQQVLTGLLPPGLTGARDFERLEGEVYILAGTPKEIFRNAQRICRF